MTLTTQDRAIRKGRVTASMVAQILGEGQFGSALTAWCEIMDMPREDISRLPHIRAGNYLEPAIVAWWQDDIGTPNGLVADMQAPPTRAHPRLSWLAATPDRLVREGDGTVAALLEAKTGGWFRADEWEDRDTREVTIPLGYQLQVQTQLEVFDLEIAYVAALIGGNRPFFGTVARDREMWASAETLLQAWYSRHVLGGVAPEPTGAECDTRALRRLHPNDNGETVILSAEGVQHAVQSVALKAQITELDTERERLRNLVRQELGDATFGEGPGVRVANKSNAKGVRVLTVK